MPLLEILLALLAVLPMLLAWLGCFWLCRELAARGQIDADWKFSWALAAVGWGTLLALITEAASLARAFNAPVVRLAWLGADVLLFAAASSLAHKRRALSFGQAAACLRGLRQTAGPSWPWDARLYLGGVVLLLAFLFAIAVSFATTNWDSLTYHLPRALHWMQQQGVDHFPTNNSRQIEYGPWSSFTLAHLMLLSGNDRLTNLVQWFAMLSTLIVLAWIVQWLGRRLGWAAFAPEAADGGAQARRITAFTCLLAATVPIGLVEAINPQTDYTATFWLCCLVALTLALLAQPANRWFALGAGLACGLGTLTKATIYVYAAPLLLGVALWFLFRAPNLRVRVLMATLFASAFFVLNAPHMLRNYSVYASPLGSARMFSIERNERITVAGTFSNLIRNLSLHTGSGIQPLTDALNGLAAEAHLWTGEGLNNPQTSYHIGVFSFRKKFTVYDSYASGAYHLLLIAAALGVALWSPRRHALLLLYAAGIVASFVLFCAYLRWQQWHGRIHLAYFTLFTPFVALLVAGRAPRWVSSSAAAVVMVFAGVTLACNTSRPIGLAEFVSLPRENQPLFGHDHRNNPPTMRLADAVVASGCDRVGLKLRFDEAEYPLWIMLRNRGFTGQLHHVYVEDASARLAGDAPPPRLLIAAAGKPPASVLALYPFQQRFGDLMLLSSTPLADSPSNAPARLEQHERLAGDHSNDGREEPQH